MIARQLRVLIAPNRRYLILGLNVLGAFFALGIAVLLADALASNQIDKAAVILGLSGLLLLLLAAPDQGLLLWVVFAPFYRFFNLDMGHGLPNLGLHRIVALVLVALMIAQTLIKRRVLLRPTIIEGLAALYVIGVLLSVPASHMSLVAGLQNVFDFVMLPLLWFYLARNLIGNRQGLMRFAIAISIAGALMGLIAMREQLTRQTLLSPVLFEQTYGQYSIKVNSLFGSAAIMSTTIAMTVGLSLIGAAQAKNWVGRIAWSCALAVSLAGLLFTYVRSGWVAASIILLLPSLFDRRVRRYVLYAAPVVALIVLMINLNQIDSRSITERIQSQRPIDYRLEMIRVGLELAARSPVFGLGLDNFGQAALAFGWRPGESVLLSVASHPHNLFVYILTSAGLVGLLPLLALLAMLGWRSLTLLRTKSDRRWPALVLGLLIGYGVGAFSFDVYLAQLANMYFFMIAGAVFGAFEASPSRMSRAEAVP